MTSPRPRVGDQIETDGGLWRTLGWCFEQGEYLIVAEGWRPWIITEDERGDAWAWSWSEEDDTGEGSGGAVVTPETLALPLTVLHAPAPVFTDPEPAPATVERVAEEFKQLHCANDEQGDSYVLGFMHGAEWAADVPAPATVEAAARVLAEHSPHLDETGVYMGACAGCAWAGGEDHEDHVVRALAAAGLLRTPVTAIEAAAKSLAVCRQMDWHGLTEGRRGWLRAEVRAVLVAAGVPVEGSQG